MNSLDNLAAVLEDEHVTRKLALKSYTPAAEFNL